MSPHLFTQRAFLCLFCVLVAAFSSKAQQPATSHHLSSSQQGIYLVFPFQNAGASPRLDWLGEGLEELTIQRLSAVGQQVYSHAGRAAELDRYGLPSSARFSRATMIRVAEDLDADYVVFGSFVSDGTHLTVDARVLRVSPIALLPAVHEQGTLNALIDLHTRVIWRLLGNIDHTYPLSLNDFSKKQRPLRLDAFEHYVRGLLASEDEQKIRELREAAKLDPDWPDPSFALGEVYFARRDCETALPWLAHVPKTHDRFVESVFDTGVCRLWLNQPDRAEAVFTVLQDSLRSNLVSGADLPEILNNLALARDRQGKTPDALADLKRASDLDPDEDAYPFNLGLLALRGNDTASAVNAFREAVEREPENPENRALLIQALEKAGRKEEADQERTSATEALGPNALPAIKLDAKGEVLAKFERVKTELDTTALRLEVVVPGTAPPSAAADSGASGMSDTPAAHVRRGRQELSAGRLDTAGKEFNAALASNPKDSAAHRGLAEIARRQNKLDDAVKEFQAALEERDSAVVRTTLAKIYLEQKKNDAARAELEHALKLAPNYAEAKQLLTRLQSGKPGGVQ